MDFALNISTEEEIAYLLAGIALHLHKRGFVEPYHHLLKARDALLDILDAACDPSSTEGLADGLPELIPQDKTIRKSGCVAV